MNYLWGAVNAISAPYQYYKDINPATLTGAIDIIVIRRPGSNGSMELSCSPFHVRFGKWQVLRPSEKKVDITVNGKSVPFNMKIGEAGEAFFVFETDNDVPEDLITSPLLEPTEPVSPDPLLLPDFGRFGAGNRKDDFMNDGIGQEPDFLDLNAPSTSASGELSRSSASSNSPHTTAISASDTSLGMSDTTAFRPVSPHEPVPFPSLCPPSALPPFPLSHSSLPPSRNSVTTDEYSWEWGGFPQRSQIHIHPTLSDTAPLRTEHDTEAVEVNQSGEFQRSKSLPPEFALDPTEGVASTLLQSDEQLNGEEFLSDVEAGFDDGDSGMSRRERRSWVRWWRRDSKHQRSVNVPFERPPLKSAVSAVLLPGESFSVHGSTADDPVRDASILSLPASSPELRTTGSSTVSGRGPKIRYAKTLRLTSEQLQALDLRPGANSITFSLSSSGVVACTARIFMWEHTENVVVSDIDGTITKSDALGHVFNLIGRDWTHVGVAKLYTDIYKNGYKIMYLTSRAIGQADSTRYYLQGIKQNDYQLPEGPVIMSPDRLMASLHREVIMRKPEVFKMACLRDIQRLFGPTTTLPFYAGFGNRITDALSYRSVNIPSSRIFTIDSNGEVKMELLDLVGHKSESVRSYIHMTDLVDQMFPPITHKWESRFTDNSFWKAPLSEFPLPELMPPSPALSARSDASNQSAFARLRNFNLRSSSSSRSRTFTPSPHTEARRGRDIDSTGSHTHQRQLSSIERLSNVLVGLANRSASPSTPSALESESEDDSDSHDASDHIGPHLRLRKRSLRSMPGSLPGSRPSSDDELEFGVTEKRVNDSVSDPGAETVEQEFDEDLFAAGEMQKVPFL